MPQRLTQRSRAEQACSRGPLVHFLDPFVTASSCLELASWPTVEKIHPLRGANRWKRLLAQDILFSWGARHKRADFLCKRRSWPSCPRSARLRRTARELGGAVPASVLDGNSGVRKELPLRGRLEPRAAWYSRCIAVPQLLWHVLLRPSRSAALIPHPIDRRALCRFREELSSEVR